MKALIIVGIVLAVLGTVLGLYNQFSVKATVERYEDSDDSQSTRLWMQAHGLYVNIGMANVVIGGLALILCVVGAMKTRWQPAWIGAAFGLVALILGLAHGTHMFAF